MNAKAEFAERKAGSESLGNTFANARIRREAHEKRAMEGELQNARAVQRVLLP